MVVAAVGEEARARDVGDLLLDSLRRHLLCVDVVGKLHPCEKSAVGDGELRLGREVFLHRTDHHVAAVLVYGAYLRDVSVEVVELYVLGDYHGTDGRGLEDGGLSDEIELLKVSLVRAYPADTVAGGEYL